MNKRNQKLRSLSQIVQDNSIETDEIMLDKLEALSFK